MHPIDRPIREEEKTAVPRGVVRLLRSGLLSEERVQRVLELHGKAVETFLDKPRDKT